MARRLFVVIPSLKEVYAVCGDTVDESMFVRDSPAPATGEFVPQRLRLADACEWIRQHSFYKFKNAQSDLSIALDPPDKVFPKFREKIGFSFNFQDAARSQKCNSQAHRATQLLERSLR